MKKSKYTFTNKDLLDTYNGFNELYFDAKLPKLASIVFKRMPRVDGRTRFMKNGEIHIFIGKKIQHHAVLVYITLLHEMAHVKVGLTISHEGRSHGFIWGSEIVRLWNLGAYEDLL